MMKGTSVGLLVLLLPSLLSAAVFNWNRRGQADDNVLRFEHQNHGQDGIVTRPQTGGTARPRFCNNLDCPKYRVIKTERTYELREYVATNWASTTSVGIDYDEASYTDFMRLFRYIGGDNAKKEKIKMTAPVLNRIIPGPGPACDNNFTMSFFMSPEAGQPPQPTNRNVSLTGMPSMRVYVKAFSGFAKKDDWLKKAAELAEDLGQAAYAKGYYYTAGYDSPYKLLNRHNEIWFIAE